MALLIVNKGDVEDAGKAFILNKPVTIIGRRTSLNKPDIELNDEVVSRRHIEILCRGEDYWLRDLGSTNGTMLNEDRIIAGNLYMLKHNSKIGIGIDNTSARIVLVFKESEDTNLIRKTESVNIKATKASKVTWLKLDEGKKEAMVDGKHKKLSKKEYELLRFLYRNSGIVCSRDEIVEAVWSEAKDTSAISDATIDQLIHRLREKIEPDPANPARIISKKAFGYMLV